MAQCKTAILILAALITSCFSCGGPTNSGTASIHAASELTLYSIHPYPWESRKSYPDAETMKGHAILSEKTIRDKSVIGKLAEALDSSLNSSEAEFAKCFYPRHAVKANGTLYLICFQCGHLYIDDKLVAIGEEGRATFDQVWKDNSMPVHRRKSLE